MPWVKGKGYVAGPEATPTGRTAVPRGTLETPWGRQTPENRQMSFARHMDFDIVLAEDVVLDTARLALIDAWETWRDAASREHYRVQDVAFEHYITAGSAHGFLLYITYSK